MFLVVGAGFSGAVIARQFADRGHRVTVVDAREHVAGNCHTARDSEVGVLEHIYGPHIFHTDNPAVWEYVNKFGEFAPYRHQVFATIDNEVYSLPINLHTINQFFRSGFRPTEAKEFLNRRTEANATEAVSFEEAAIKSVGVELYEAFFYGYTVKQWGRHPREIPASVFGRLPVRFTYDTNYFFHRFQGIPRHGYTNIVQNILDHQLITVSLGEQLSREDRALFKHVFWTGPIDAYFGCIEGSLEYRTLRFEREVLLGDFQGCAVMNYPKLDVRHTRVTEHKHFAPWESHQKSVIYREFSDECRVGDIPYYPVRLTNDKSILHIYTKMAQEEKDITFLGRLGTYRYIDMDVAIREALETANESLACIERRDPLPSFFYPPT